MNINIILRISVIILCLFIGFMIHEIIYRYKTKKNSSNEMNNVFQSNNEDFRIISYDTPRKIKCDESDYLGFFYSWYELKDYLKSRKPEMYCNKIVSLEISHKYRFFLIISNCMVEEVTVFNGK